VSPHNAKMLNQAGQHTLALQLGSQQDVSIQQHLHGQVLTLKPMSSLKGYASADVKPVPSVTRELAISAASKMIPAPVKQSDIHPEKVVSRTPLCRGNISAHLHM
jgi:hypothetical protein